MEVPKLADDVLRHLLEEAKEAGITSSRSTDTKRSLSTVNEGEEREEDDESEAVTGRSSEGETCMLKEGGLGINLSYRFTPLFEL